MKPLLALLFALCFAASAQAAAPQEVAKGSELRAYLFDLARSTAVKQAGKPVRFEGSLKQLNGWAFFNGSIVDDAGKRVRVGEADSADTVILWKKAGDEWSLVTCAVGITDVCYDGWPKEYGAPKALLFAEY